jgi:hypothetical protein
MSLVMRSVFYAAVVVVLLAYRVVMVVVRSRQKHARESLKRAEALSQTS